MTREEKRIEILNGAAYVFSRNGFHGAKIEDIAKRAGIGKGTLYGYFDSKESLFNELIRYGIGEYKVGIEKILEEGTVRDKTIKLFKYHGKFLSKYIDMTKIFISQQDIFPVEIKEKMIEEKMEIFKMLEEMIEEGKKTGEFKKDLNEELATLAIIGAINQFYGKKMFFDKLSYKEISPEPMIDTLFHGFKS